MYGDENLAHTCIVTMAPELEGAQASIKGLQERGVVVSAGHSTATIEQALAGVEASLSLFARRRR